MQDSQFLSFCYVLIVGVFGWLIVYLCLFMLYGYWLKCYGIVGYYIFVVVVFEDLVEVLCVMLCMGFVGVNVIILYKESVLVLVDVVIDRVVLIGVVNMLIFCFDGKIYVDNIDGYGFIVNLCQYVLDWVFDCGLVVVIGVGGVVWVVVVLLLEFGVIELCIVNCICICVEQICSEFGVKVVVYDWVEVGNMLDGVLIVVNVILMGMDGKFVLCVLLDVLVLGVLVIDLVYMLLMMFFFEEVQVCGCQIVDGLGMLLYQGVLGFECWFGQCFEVDDVLCWVVLV